MIDHVLKLSPIKVTEAPTLPLTDVQYKKLLESIPKEFRSPDKVKRVHALIRLMRYSGLAIQDAVTLERDQIQKDAKKYLQSGDKSAEDRNTCVSSLPS